MSTWLVLQLLSFASAQSVQVNAGVINGLNCSSANVSGYFGIPYAKPPINELRFAPTQPYNSTYPLGKLNATTQPKICVQFSAAYSDPEIESEDCLYLNIYAPTFATANSNLPVKFWIYGGAFAAGGITSAQYNGCNIATDAILVLAAYRLGPLGFLYDPLAGIQGNMGVQDLLTALEWVQSNIASFGGDPKKVVVFGQSAGAISSWLLSTLPSAPSLMSAVICESGAGSPLSSPAAAVNFSRPFELNLGCNSNIDCYRNVSTGALFNATPPAPELELVTEGTRIGPVIDGNVIPSDPNVVGSKVPLLAGAATMEGTIFTLYRDGDLSAWTPQFYYEIISTYFGSYASEINSTFPVSLFENTPYPAFYATANLVTKFSFFCPTLLALTSTVAAGQPAWVYLWDHTPTCFWDTFFNQLGSGGPEILQLLGPTHSTEILYVFNQTTNLPLPNGGCNFTAEEDIIANYLVNAWTSMADGQHPGMDWPQWNANTSLGLRIVNSTGFGYINFMGCDRLNEIMAAVELANLST